MMETFLALLNYYSGEDKTPSLQKSKNLMAKIFWKVPLEEVPFPVMCLLNLIAMKKLQQMNKSELNYVEYTNLR